MGISDIDGWLVMRVALATRRGLEVEVAATVGSRAALKFDGGKVPDSSELVSTFLDLGWCLSPERTASRSFLNILTIT